MTINSSTIIVARMYGMRAIPPPGFNNSWTNDILVFKMTVERGEQPKKYYGIDDWEAGRRGRELLVAQGCGKGATMLQFQYG